VLKTSNVDLSELQNNGVLVTRVNPTFNLPSAAQGMVRY